MPDLYNLGLEERDRVNPSLGGGLPEGSIVLIEGKHGAGKSVITQRFCYGLCETGTNVTYVSAEHTAGGLIKQMGSMEYDIVDHLLREQLLFLHADVDTVDTINGDEDPEPSTGRELITQMMRAEVMWRSDVIIFDGFDGILLHDPHYEAISEHGDADDIMQNLITYFRQIVGQDKTIVLTVNPDSLSRTALRPLRDVSNVYLSLEMESIGNEVRRKMVVKKFAGMGNQVDDNIGFAVQSGRGLTIVTRTVA
ncbi:flagellar protein FlaH [Natronoarchaeum philippinense]|uniref:Flagellar protein FlaH n=1 Tax=Natronoarchaeum philippinense TaxID=558529 RepID=A0A285N7Z1_NATPI|nr:ATPase domain-containing protein [Natronoarchaeum philippinense]SNZ05604.1 flagellar protein FlaH [Natronoarchaeum philippinense]